VTTGSPVDANFPTNRQISDSFGLTRKKARVLNHRGISGQRAAIARRRRAGTAYGVYRCSLCRLISTPPGTPSLDLADPVDVFTEATRKLEGPTHELRRSSTCKYQLKKANQTSETVAAEKKRSTGPAGSRRSGAEVSRGGSCKIALMGARYQSEGMAVHDSAQFAFSDLRRSVREAAYSRSR